jgi:hypothetical protein
LKFQARNGWSSYFPWLKMRENLTGRRRCMTEREVRIRVSASLSLMRILMASTVQRSIVVARIAHQIMTEGVP